MGANRRQRREKERRLRQYLMFMIDTFDNKPVDTTIWFSMGKRKVRDVDSKGRRVYKEIRHVYLPQLLDLYQESGVITLEKRDNLVSMLYSDDRENWYVAIQIIKLIRKKR